MRIEGENWEWVGHFLAILFSVVLLGLLAVTVVAFKDLEGAKTLMGFSSALLGVIITFYFQRGRIERESRLRERATEVGDLAHQALGSMRSRLGYLERLIEEEEEEEGGSG